MGPCPSCAGAPRAGSRDLDGILPEQSREAESSPIWSCGLEVPLCKGVGEVTGTMGSRNFNVKKGFHALRCLRHLRASLFTKGLGGLCSPERGHPAAVLKACGRYQPVGKEMVLLGHPQDKDSPNSKLSFPTGGCGGPLQLGIFCGLLEQERPVPSVVLGAVSGSFQKAGAPCLPSGISMPHSERGAWPRKIWKELRNSKNTSALRAQEHPATLHLSSPDMWELGRTRHQGWD
ncbi:uncharacterized protein LOC126650294 [Myiozetetes cayanensis]|uniref:uncharacterized protein LOC126650294 n=1 Tax=Myiozetetes cayanensis TaxID=478635 RepID=UPI00215F913B|nr:uncharacterized protein LOC126650294 [Myiozetetes cayanensis]